MNEYKNECKTCRNEEEVVGNERTREKWEWEKSENKRKVGTRKCIYLNEQDNKNISIFQ